MPMPGRDIPSTSQPPQPRGARRILGRVPRANLHTCMLTFDVGAESAAGLSLSEERNARLEALLKQALGSQIPGGGL